MAFAVYLIKDFIPKALEINKIYQYDKPLQGENQKSKTDLSRPENNITLLYR